MGEEHSDYNFVIEALKISAGIVFNSLGTGEKGVFGPIRGCASLIAMACTLLSAGHCRGSMILRSPARLRRNGFTLIEIVLSLGVVSLVMVALMGTLPAGLDALNTAQKLSLEGQILRDVEAKIRSVPFDVAAGREQTNSTASIPGRLYYGWDGVPLGTNANSDDAETALEVDIQLLDRAAQPLPGAQWGDSSRPRFATYRVSVFRAGDTDAARQAADNDPDLGRIRLARFHLTIGDDGRRASSTRP